MSEKIVRRNFEGYVEPIRQNYATYENAPINIPASQYLRTNNAIALHVGLQPHPGAMFVHSVPNQNNPMNKAIPFMRVANGD